MFRVQIPVDAFPTFVLNRRSFSFGIDRMDPVEPERFDWVFLFLIFIILGIYFKFYGFLFISLLNDCFGVRKR